MDLFYAIVENNLDPELLGRVQVRIVGLHTENRTDPTADDYLAVEDLPWAQTLQLGTTVSNKSNFVIPENGTVVVVSFMDAEQQMPLILGSVPKLVEELPDFTQGFTDPAGINPTEDSVGISPISRYATGAPPPDAVTERAADVETGVQCVDEVWSESPTTFAPIYPYNQVWQSGQNVFELDATPGNERICFQHNLGGFKEVHPNGESVEKIKGDGTLIIEGDRNILVKGGSKVTVRGLTSGYNLEASRDIKSKSVTGNIEMEAAAGSINLDAKVNHTQKSVALMEMETEGAMNITAGLTINVDTDGVLNIQAASAFINIDGACIVSASLISLN